LEACQQKPPLLANDARNGAPGIINNATQNQKLALSRNSKQHIDTYRQLGNFSAHRIEYICRREYPEFRLGTTSQAVVSFEKREGRYRSAERVEAHLQVNLVSRYFFRPEIADDGQSMKGVRNVEPSLRRGSRPS
jgi:hypothetical protein